MRRFWLRWAFGTAVGSALGGLAADLLLARIQRVVLQRGMDAISDASGLTVAGASALVGGLLVGVIQAWMLRGRVPRAGWRWIAATLAGHISMIRLQGFGAVVLGTLQWLILRRTVSRSWVWVVVSTVGWALAMVVTNRMGESGAVGGWALGFTNGAIAGAVTGPWMARRPRTPAPDDQGNAAATNASA